MDNVVRDIIANYISSFLATLAAEGLHFEYYYINRNHAECTVKNYSDSEISFKYPLSGERLILDCWYLVKEHLSLCDADWCCFVITINDLVLEVQNESK